MTDKKQMEMFKAETTWFHVFVSMIENGDVAKMGPYAVTVYLVVKASGSGKKASSLKALRMKMSAKISNCLPREREKEQGKVKTRLTTSKTSTTVKAMLMAWKWLLGRAVAQTCGSQPCRFNSMVKRAAIKSRTMAKAIFRCRASRMYRAWSGSKR